MRKAGAVPTMARGPRSIANLKRGGSPGRPKLSPEDKAIDKQIRVISRNLLLDPVYQANLQERLREGRLQPGVEVALYQYAFGKPTETIEDKRITPVRIVNKYTK